MFLEMMIQMRRNVIYSMFMFQPRIEPVQETLATA
jgi:preprotein translocase subunit SecA